MVYLNRFNICSYSNLLMFSSNLNVVLPILESTEIEFEFEITNISNGSKKTNWKTILTYAYLYFIPYFWFVAWHTRVIFPAYVRIFLAWDLQNRSVSALWRFRFIEVRRPYKTIGIRRDHRKIPYWIVFRFIQGPLYTVFTVLLFITNSNKLFQLKTRVYFTNN